MMEKPIKMVQNIMQVECVCPPLCQYKTTNMVNKSENWEQFLKESPYCLYPVNQFATDSAGHFT